MEHQHREVRLVRVPADSRNAGSTAELMNMLGRALLIPGPIVPGTGGLSAAHADHEPIAVQPVASAETPAPTGPLPPTTALVIHTTGSTGIPKFVALSADTLRANARATQEALGGAGQWLLALPTHLIAGAQILVRSLVAATLPVTLDGPFSPQSFVAAAEQLTAPKRFTSLVPVQLARLLEHAEHDPRALAALRRFDVILVGGQSVSLALRSRAHELGIEIRRTYGMTETAGGVVYDGVPIGETRVRIRHGEILIGGPSLAESYLDDADQTGDRFIVDSGERWFRTGDTGALVGGVLEVTGRMDRVITSGGVNVSLDAVERVMHESPAWADAVAVGYPDEEWGERVVIITESEIPAAAFEELSSQLREQIGRAAVPARSMVVERIPRFANGKPDYRSLTV